MRENAASEFAADRDEAGREMDKLYEVERLTIFKATSTFVMMQNRGAAA